MIVENQIIHEPYSKETWGAYLGLYKENKELFDVYSQFIDQALSSVFPNNSKTINGIIGVYDIESDGWSVLNKLNTNMLGFSILITDINNVLTKNGGQSIDLLDKSLTKDDIKQRIFQLIEFIDKFKLRIFSHESKTFKKLISALNDTTKKGDLTESISFEILKKKFGDNNVTVISGYGERKDMIGGIDIEIKLNGLLAQAQIKPAKDINEENGEFIITPSSSVRQYKTDWLIFEKNKKLHIFTNKNCKLVDGKYFFKKNDLLYILT